MKLYKTTYKTSVVGHDGQYMTKAKWHGSASDASKCRTALKLENKAFSPATEVLETSVVKAELLAFLNRLTD